MGKSTVTGRINAKAFELLEQHQEGLHWSELLSKIEASDSSCDGDTKRDYLLTFGGF